MNTFYNAQSDGDDSTFFRSKRKTPSNVYGVCDAFRYQDTDHFQCGRRGKPRSVPTVVRDHKPSHRPANFKTGSGCSRHILSKKKQLRHQCSPL